MADTTVTKVSSAHSPTGDQGEVYLASGKRVSMRLWRDEPELNGNLDDGSIRRRFVTAFE
jgi:hypothetical protein